MTNTTDIAAFYAIAAKAKETGTSFVIPAETAISILKHIGVLRDNLEAERQRADKNGKMSERVAGQRDEAFADIWKAEAELEALKAEIERVESQSSSRLAGLRKAIESRLALEARLANPVVLPKAYRQYDHWVHGLEQQDAYGMSHGSKDMLAEIEGAIHLAGFTTVKGE